MSNSVVPLDKQNAARLNEGELFDLVFRLNELQRQPVNNVVQRQVSAPSPPKLQQSDLELSGLKYVLLSYHKECSKRSCANCAISTCALIISIAVAVVLAFVFYDHNNSHGKHTSTTNTNLYEYT